MKKFRLLIYIIIFLLSSNLHGQEINNQNTTDYNFEELFNHIYNAYIENKQFDNLSENLYDSIFPESRLYLQTEENIDKDSIKTYFNFKKLYFDSKNHGDYSYGNVCSIIINTKDSIFIRGETFDEEDKFNQFIYNFLLNPYYDVDLPEKEPKTVQYFGEVMVSRAIIFLNAQMVSDSLKQRTSIKILLKKINQIISLNNQLRNELAILKWNETYNELQIQKRLTINQIYPLRMKIILNYEVLPPPPPPPPHDKDEEDFFNGKWKNKKNNR